MRMSSIRLENFKRFTDLLVHNIPETAKLVVLVGPNGCGKSSLFDGFIEWYRRKAKFGGASDDSYCRKDPERPYQVDVTLHGDVRPKRGCLYVRTAYRNDPDFLIDGINRPRNPSGELRVARAIDNDGAAVMENYQRLVYDTTAAVYDPANDAKTVRNLREELIGQIRASMERVFGDLLLNDISDPFGPGTFYFGKGSAKEYQFKNLSGGEKGAFDLLLDLHVKKEYLPDAVYCVDEVDAHLHTRAQGTLVKEMTKILPGDSQLWVATHSLGVIRAAQEIEASTPGSVCIIDFEGVDLDMPMELVPATLGRVSWEKLLSITLDDLSKRIAPKILVVCEGSATGTRRKDFDAAIYSQILGGQAAEVVFVSGGSSQQVEETGSSVREILSRILPTTKIVGLVDRDDRSAAQVAECESKGNIVLTERNLESYMFGDDVIEALVEREGKANILDDALKIKADALAKSCARGNPPDDLKSARGEIYTNLKTLLQLRRAGNNADAFVRDTLAPLVVPRMATYKKLKADVLDKTGS
jgi:AAA domain, putative AbiEii toxin, Type IV TA system